LCYVSFLERFAYTREDDFWGSKNGNRNKKIKKKKQKVECKENEKLNECRCIILGQYLDNDPKRGKRIALSVMIGIVYFYFIFDNFME